MDLAKVPQKFRKELLRDLLLGLRAAQLRLGNEAQTGRFVAIESGGTMPDDAAQIDQWWANELHPTLKGWKLLSKRAFVPALKKAAGT